MDIQAWLATRDWVETAKLVAPWVAIAITFTIAMENRLKAARDRAELEARRFTLKTMRFSREEPTAYLLRLALEPPARHTAYAVTAQALDGATLTPVAPKPDMGIVLRVRPRLGRADVPPATVLAVDLREEGEELVGHVICDGRESRRRVRFTVRDGATNRTVLRRTFDILAAD